MTARPVSPGEPRALLDEAIDYLDAAIDDTHPEGDTCDICVAATNLRETFDRLFPPHPATEPVTAAPATREHYHPTPDAAYECQSGIDPCQPTALSCLGCGQIGTPSTFHKPSGQYLCAERCVPAIRLREVAALPEGRETVLREALWLARVAANNWHLNRYPEHGDTRNPQRHDLAADCPEPMFVRLTEQLTALSAAPEVPVDRIAVERLATAIYNANAAAIPNNQEWRDSLRNNARRIAAEYARLAAAAKDRHGPDPAKERCRACGEPWPCPLVVADGMRTRGTDRTDR